MRHFGLQYIINVFATFLLYLFSPKEYSLAFCVLCFAAYLYIVLPAILYDFQKKQYLSFNFFFFLSLLFASFIAPIFIGVDLGAFSYYSRFVNSGTALVVFASSLYICGWKFSIIKHSNYRPRTIPVFTERAIHFLHVCSLLTTLLYFYFLRQFIDSLMGLTNDMGTGYLITLVQTFIILSLIADSIKYKNSGLNSVVAYLRIAIVPLSCSLFIILTSIVIVGDRTMPLFLIIAIGMSFITYVRKISFPVMAIALILGISVMFTIGRNRGGNDSYYGSSFSSMVETTGTTISQTDAVEDMFEDYIPASMSIYMLMSWREEHGGNLYYPGKIFIAPFLPIPYIPSILSDLFYGVKQQGDLNSGVLTTQIRNRISHYSDSGVGTHVVGDVYVSWGIIGIILMFFYFGKLVGQSQLKCSDNIFYALIYITLTCDAVYMARATLFLDIRNIGFQFFLVFLLQQLYHSKINKPL